MKCFGCGGVGNKQQECRVKSTGAAEAAVVEEDSTEECSAGGTLSPLNENREQNIGI